MKNKKKFVIWFWLVLILFCAIILFFFSWKQAKDLEKQTKKVQEKAIFTIHYWTWESFAFDIDKKIKEKCFAYSTWFTLINDNVIEKSFKIPSETFSCIEDSLQFQEIKKTSRKDVVVDKDWNIHIINSNINLNLNWVKIYWQ